MDGLSMAIALVAGFALLMSLFTDALRRSVFREPLLAMLFGILMGPYALGWLHAVTAPHQELLLEHTARFTLALVLFGVGLELPRGYWRQHRRELLVLFGVGLVAMGGISAALAAGWLGLGLVGALLVGAVLAPTDPVLAAGVVAGPVARRDLPARLRHLLSAETGLRHGLGLVFVMLAVSFMTRPATEAAGHWLTRSVLAEGLGGALLGAAAAGLVGAVQVRAHERRWSEPGALMVTHLAMAIATVAALQVLGADSLLGVFTAGLAYAIFRRRNETPEQLEEARDRVMDLIKRVLQVPVFVLFGVALPWGAWADMGWPALGFVITLLLLRRLPVLLLLRPSLSSIRNWREALFVGWFGPVGVGALELSLVAHKHTHFEPVWAIGSLAIAVSIAANDLLVTPLSDRLGASETEPEEPPST